MADEKINKNLDITPEMISNLVNMLKPFNNSASSTSSSSTISNNSDDLSKYYSISDNSNYVSSSNNLNGSNNTNSFNTSNGLNDMNSFNMSNDSNNKDSSNTSNSSFDILKNFFNANLGNEKNSSSSSETSTSNSDFSSKIDFETILKIKSIMETLNKNDDPRSNLLYSLKPYLRESRQKKIDQYVNLLKITNLSGLFNFNKGDEN